MPSLISASAVTLSRNSGLHLLSLPALASVQQIGVNDINTHLYGGAGSFVVSNCRLLRELRLPAVTTMTGSITVTAGDSQYLYLTTVSMPGLVSIAGSIALSRLPLLRDLALEALRSVKGSFTLSRNSGLRSAALPNLNSSGAVSVQDNSALALVSLPNLAKAGAITFKSNAALTSLSMRRLAEASALTITNCNSLRTLAGLDTLTKLPGRLTISSNAQLMCIKSLGNVTHIGGTLTVTGNPELHICNDLYSRLKAAAQNRIAKGNSFEPRDHCNHRCI